MVEHAYCCNFGQAALAVKALISSSDASIPRLFDFPAGSMNDSVIAILIYLWPYRLNIASTKHFLVQLEL